MRILFLNEYRIEADCGGVQKVTSILSEFLKNHSYEVYFLYFKENYQTKSLNNQHINFNELKISNSQLNLKENYSLINSFLKDNKIDIIINQFGFNEKIISLFVEIKCPIISVLHSCPDFELKNMQFTFGKKISHKYSFHLNLKILLYPLYKYYFRIKIAKKLRTVYKKSSSVILLSEKYIPIFKRIARIRCSDKLIAIPNPIDPEFKKGQSINIEKSKEILFVGRLNTGKRINLLLDIWSNIEKSYPDWYLNILGSGPDFEPLKDYSRSKKLQNVNFLNHQKDTSKYYKKASIFVMTSAYEGFPLVIVEAQNFGTVPIVYDTFESLSEIITNSENGYIIPNLNQCQFQDKIKLLIESPYKLSEMSQICRSRTDKYIIEIIGKKWIQILEKTYWKNLKEI